jgi:hypothetical protein
MSQGAHMGINQGGASMSRLRLKSSLGIFILLLSLSGCRCFQCWRSHHKDLGTPPPGVRQGIVEIFRHDPDYTHPPATTHGMSADVHDRLIGYLVYDSAVEGRTWWIMSEGENLLPELPASAVATVAPPPPPPPAGLFPTVVAPKYLKWVLLSPATPAETAEMSESEWRAWLCASFGMNLTAPHTWRFDQFTDDRRCGD